MNVRVPMGALRLASRAWPGLICFGRAGDRTGRVAISFDDGPNERHTPRVLDALAEAGATATFFMQGAMARKHPGLVRRAFREGHHVAGHGEEHVSALKLPGAEVLRNAARCHETLVDILGTPIPRDFRPPYGDMTVAGLRHLGTQGYRLAYWSFDSNDSFVSTADEVVARVRGQTPPAGSILLFHDDYAHTADALPRVLGALRERGVTAVSIGELCPR